MFTEYLIQPSLTFFLRLAKGKAQMTRVHSFLILKHTNLRNEEQPSSLSVASLVHNFVKHVMYISPTLLQLQQILRTRSPMPKSFPECITLSLPANFEERALSSSSNAEDFRLNFRFFSLFSPVSFFFFRFLIFF